MLVNFEARVLEINGELATEDTEVFRPSLFKDYSTGLAQEDMLEFLKWFTGPSVQLVKGREKIQRKLQELKHERFAKLHVYCPDGKVLPSLRMSARRIGESPISYHFLRQ
jgi:hypothetical protein